MTKSWKSRQTSSPSWNGKASGHLLLFQVICSRYGACHKNRWGKEPRKPPPSFPNPLSLLWTSPCSWPPAIFLFALVIQSPSGLKMLSRCCFLNSLMFPFAAGLVVETASLFCLQPSVSLSSSAHWTVSWLLWRRELCSFLCPWSPKTERWGSMLTAHLHTPDSQPASPTRPALSAAGTGHRDTEGWGARSTARSSSCTSSADTCRTLPFLPFPHWPRPEESSLGHSRTQPATWGVTPSQIIRGRVLGALWHLAGI